MYIPQGLVSAIAAVSPNAIFSKVTHEKVIGLTIDDVPTASQPGYPSTQRILGAIADYNQTLVDQTYRAHATFFVIGEQLTHGTNILHQIIEQGHEIGNHGMRDHTHASLPYGVLDEEIWRSHQLLTSDTGAQIQWFRPGRGIYNQGMVTMLRRLQPHGYHPKVVLASMVPLDTRSEFKSPAFTVQYASTFVFPGAILVLHGGSEERDRNTAQVLRTLLPRLQAKGYRAITLSQLFSQPTQLSPLQSG